MEGVKSSALKRKNIFRVDKSLFCTVYAGNYAVLRNKQIFFASFLHVADRKTNAVRN